MPIWIILFLFVLYALFKPKLFGHIGESIVRFKLSKLDQSEYKVINNFMIAIDDKSSEIDHIVVSQYGVFVIETKNYRGLITGHEKCKEWTQYINKYKSKFYNPVRQNYGHVMVLKKVFSKYPKIPFIPIVVFTGDAKLKIKTDSSIVIESKDLKRTIESYNRSILTSEEVIFAYGTLLTLNINNQNNRKEHIAWIREKK